MFTHFFIFQHTVYIFLWEYVSKVEYFNFLTWTQTA